MEDLVDALGKRGRTEAALRQRFDSMVQKTDNCWLWMGTLNERGYGIISIADRNRAAHRVAWILSNGPIPDGLMVCHCCDNPRCVRSDHFFLGTCKDNISDCVSKGRNNFGSRNGMSKLSTEQVADIHRLKSEGVKLVEIASRFGVNVSCVCKITLGQRWTSPSIQQEIEGFLK